MAVPSVRALSRGLAVIEVLAQASGPLGPREVAEATGLDRGTTSRLLQTLVDDEYVRRTGHGRYVLTARLIVMAASAGIGGELRETARPFMRELRDTYEETIHLGVLEDDRVVYIEKMEPARQRVALITSVGQSMPVHSTALGKAILAGFPADRVHELLSRIDYSARTPSTVTSRDAFEAELERARKRGYGVDHGENLPDASCVAAAIREGSGDVIGAISMSSPTFRIADRFEELGPAVHAVAEQISLALGFAGRPESNT